MSQHAAPQTVLIVDDDAELRAVFSEYIRFRGFHVLEAKDGLEALLQVKRERPHAIILDLAMPRLGGIDALKRIVKFDPTITVVVDEKLRIVSDELWAAAQRARRRTNGTLVRQAHG